MHIKLSVEEHALLWRHEESAKLFIALHCVRDSLLFSCSNEEFEAFTDICCRLLLAVGLTSDGGLNADGRLLDGLIDRTYVGFGLLSAR